MVTEAIDKSSVEVTHKTLSKEQLLGFVDAMIADLSVKGVKAKRGSEESFLFGEIDCAKQLRLDYDVTILPPKKYLMPPCEVLTKFTLGDSPSAEPCVAEPSQIVLVGIHPYDMIAINQIDQVMSEPNSDPNYAARRDALTIIGVDPARAGERAFWGPMDCDSVADGFDLWLCDLGDKYLIEVGSARGEALLEKYADARDATDDELQAQMDARKEIAGLCATGEANFTTAELPNLLRENFDHKVWSDKAETCLSCGSCNLVCPTCYCFDVKDEVDLSMETGQRYRIWDGCLLEDFAKVAGNENFRERRLQRYRHRLFRKGMYQFDKYGQIACVGCGRCATACLPDIANPVDVFNTLKEES